MGILQRKHDSNVLTDNGFTHKDHSVTGAIPDCYERCIPAGPYYAYIAVSIRTGKIFIYIEYDCGGEIASYTSQCTSHWDDDSDTFFAELDEYATDILSYYEDE